MAAGPYTLYSNALLAIGKGQMNLLTDTFVTALITSAYTPAPNTDALWSAVSGNEAAGAGYTAGGIALSGQSWALAAATCTFNGTGPSWASSTITAKYGVIVRRAGASLAAGDLLVAYTDLNTAGGSLASNAGTFSITEGAGGIFTLTHTP